MKLSLFSYNFFPEPTGIPAFNTSMASWLALKAGWGVQVHTGIPHYPWWKPHPDYRDRDFRRGRANERIAGVAVRRVRHYIPSLPLTGPKRMLLDATWVWQTFWDCLRVRERPDAILMVSPPFLGALLGIALRLWWRCPVIYHVQDLQIDAAMDLSMIGRRIGNVLLWLERLLLGRVDLVTTISRSMKQRLEAKTGLRRPVVLLPNWADVEAIREHRGENAWRRAWCTDERDVVILYSGNLGRKQGLDVLLEAFALLPSDRGLRLVIAGDGPERQPLEHRARELGLGDRLRFEPLVPADRLAEFLSAGDVHCIPQLRAAADLVLPSKLLNIMAVARPVVATADPSTDLARTIGEAGCGAIVEPERPELLAERLLELAGRPDERQRMGVAGRAYVEEHFSIDRILGRFTSCMDRLMHAADGKPRRTLSCRPHGLFPLGSGLFPKA